MPFNIGPLELVIVLVIALLVIGPKRLPEMGNSLGKTIREFRKASSDMSEAVSLEPESKPAAQQASTTTAATAPAPASAPAPATEAPPAAEAPTPATAEAPTLPAAEAPTPATAPAESPAEPKSDDV
jgi:TatA/E family protein of Tat protein translocase